MDRKKRNRRRALRAKCEVVGPFHWVLSNWRSPRPDGRANVTFDIETFDARVDALLRDPTPSLRTKIDEATATLTDREREVLRTRFGIE